MAEKVALIDTSILIDHFRKSDKANSVLFKLFRQGYDLKISAITEFEVYSGANTFQLPFWDDPLKHIPVLPFDQKAAKQAVSIYHILKQKNKKIEMADLFIGATSIANDLPIATLNKKHFERIAGLSLIEE